MAIQFPVQQMSSLPNSVAGPEIEPSLDNNGCSICTTFEIGLCAAIKRINADEVHRILGGPLVGPLNTSPARRTIYHPTEWSDFVSVICHGWATTSIAL